MARVLTWMASKAPARARLVVFPHAGSGAGAYRGWRALLPADVELGLVHLPGREARLSEPPLTSVHAMADIVADALVREPARIPLALFGHSLGAHVAFETARRPGVKPDRLLVSGNRGPSLPFPRAPIHHLDDARILEEFERLGGTPPEILQHAELMALLRPILRADLQAAETYAYVQGSPLACPITAYGGADDPNVPTGSLDAWRHETTGPFRMRVLPGGHFSIFQDARDAFHADLAAELRALARAPGSTQEPS